MPMTTPPLEDLRQEVNQALGAHIASLPAGRLVDAMGYALLGSGKRLRPLLCMAACIDSGGARETALSPACAAEMIHSYSLAHDDLPCMDDDDERRGSPSLHKAFDEATALLAGDALQTLAFRTLADCPGVSDEVRVRMLKELSDAGGAAGMAGGQMLDLLCDDVATRDLAHLKNTQAMKTGALFRAALRLGLVSANRDIHLLDAFASSFGLAFQAADDLRDCLGEREVLGKPPGSDLRHNKLTWVSLIGIEEAQAALAKLRLSCKDELRHADFEPVLLAQVTQLALGTDDLLGIS